MAAGADDIGSGRSSTTRPAGQEGRAKPEASSSGGVPDVAKVAKGLPLEEYVASEEELKQDYEVGIFTQQAEAATKTAVFVFRHELAQEATRLASRQEADNVSEVHVKEALRRLTALPPRRRFYQSLEVLGGALLGSGASGLASFLLMAPAAAQPLGVVVSALAAVVGALMLGIAFARDR